jgi:ATP adenylyltransferase
MPYIEGRASEEGCILCSRLAQPDGPENLILHRGAKVFVILNRYPYSNGHLMVAPLAHRSSLEDLDESTLGELMRSTTQCMRVLRQVYSAQAFNIGVNIGAAAGAGITDHVHVHVVPRWSGDTNFMATTAETRVIPEALRRTYERLSAAWQASEESK